MSDRGGRARSRLVAALRLLLALAFVGAPLYSFLAGFLAGEWEQYRLRRDWPDFHAHYQRGQTLLYDQDYAAALTALDRAVAAARAATAFDPLYLAKTYALKGEAHIQLWQYVDAAAAYQAALAAAGPDQRPALRQRLATVQQHIERNEQERDDRTVYEATTDAGPARRLRGKVVVAYVFVDDGKISRWSKRQRQRALDAFAAVERWYGERARAYGVDDLSFSGRHFVFDRDPLLRNALEKVGAREVAVASDLAGRVAALQGADTVNGFLQRLRDEAGADQALLLLHVNHQARSFALPCRSPCWGRTEYAYIFETPGRHQWDALQYTQAHEGLHLFGADDLYNIASARDYAPRDIMNHLPRYLDATRVDSITAYAIGWVGRRPQAPFAVKHTGGKR